MKKAAEQTSLEVSSLQLVNATLERVEWKIALIDEAKSLANQCVESNASLEDEERAAILEQFIEWSSTLKIVPTISWERLIHWNWMLGFNVISTKTWNKVWIIKTFSRDANVLFQPYWNKTAIKLWKLTKDWIKRIAQVA